MRLGFDQARVRVGSGGLAALVQVGYFGRLSWRWLHVQLVQAARWTGALSRLLAGLKLQLFKFINFEIMYSKFYFIVNEFISNFFKSKLE